MAKTVDQIRAQIARLQEQERAILQKEVAGVIAKIKMAVEHYGLTADQIFDSNSSAKPVAKRAAAAGKRVAGRRKVALAKSARPPKEPKAAKPAKRVSSAKGTKVAVKFKGDNGNTWTGRGSRPRWLRAAVEAGKKVEDFAV